MSRRANVIRHGLNHVQGGSDPIPWTGVPSGGAVGSFADYVLSLSGLVGCWRLGEAASPFADTSGNVAGPSNMIRQAAGTALTADVAGALGQFDDGAVQLNAAGSGTSHAGDWLQTTSAGSYLNPASVTLAVWLKPAANAATFAGHAFGNFKPEIVAGHAGGHAIFVDWPTLSLRYTRAASSSSTTTFIDVNGGALTPGVWVFVVATYDSATHEIRIYVDGALADSDTTTITTATAGVYLGLGASSNPAIDYAFVIPRPDMFLGAIDEAAAWSRALTASEVLNLYTLGVATGPADAGKVLTADGAGGSSFEWGTLEVDGARYEEILTGANLTSTDNTDGTVTLASAGSDPADDTEVWMPLVDSDGTCVLDGTGNLIPTLIPL